MNLTSSDATPSDPPADASVSAGGSLGEDRAFDWAALLRLVHPLKVAIVEALLFSGRPLSASDLSKCFGGAAGGLSHISYHVGSLAKAGVIEQVSERQVRGAVEKFYSLS